MEFGFLWQSYSDQWRGPSDSGYSTAAFHARARGSFPGLGVLKEIKMFPPHPLLKLIFVGIPRDREVGCSASDQQGLNFKLCVWRAVSSHHPQEVLLAQFSLYVHKSGLKPDSFYLPVTSLLFFFMFYALYRSLKNCNSEMGHMNK